MHLSTVKLTGARRASALDEMLCLTTNGGAMNTQLRWLVPAETTTKPSRLQVRSVNSIGQVVVDWRDVPLVVAPEVGAGETAKRCDQD